MVGISTSMTPNANHKNAFTAKIIAWSASNRWLVIGLTAAAVAYAIYTWNNIRLDAIPDLSDTQVIVYTKWDRSPTSWKIR